MLDRVSRGVDAQKRFVTDAAHELCSPIAASTSLLEVGIHSPDTDWPSIAADVLSEQRRLGALVDDLVLLARLDEGGPRAKDRRPFSLDDIVVNETSAPLPVAIEVVSIEPCVVNGNEWSMIRVVRNLLSNAGRHATSKVEVHLLRTADRVVLIVDDDGPGIDEEDRATIFDRFARLDEGRSRDNGGSGIGLSIVKQVVESHGGDITVDESPMGGARLVATLPAHG